MTATIGTALTMGPARPTIKGDELPSSLDASRCSKQPTRTASTIQPRVAAPVSGSSIFRLRIDSEQGLEMVGKKSGKALLREEGKRSPPTVPRTEN